MKDRGFSLFELLVVLILLSLSLALVAPSLSRFSRTVDLEGAAQKVSGILRNSRSEAVNKGKVYQVVFNSQSREVRVHSMEPSEEKDERKEGPVPEKTYLLPEGIQMKGDPTTSSPSASELSPIELFSGSLRLVRTSGEYTKAVNYARVKMEEVTVKPTMNEGIEEGEFDGASRWQVDVKRVDILPARIEKDFQPPEELFQVKIHVLWKSGTKERSTVLETYRTIKLEEEEKKS